MTFNSFRLSALSGLVFLCSSSFAVPSAHGVDETLFQSSNLYTQRIHSEFVDFPVLAQVLSDNFFYRMSRPELRKVTLQTTMVLKPANISATQLMERYGRASGQLAVNLDLENYFPKSIDKADTTEDIAKGAALIQSGNSSLSWKIAELVNNRAGHLHLSVQLPDDAHFEGRRMTAIIQSLYSMIQSVNVISSNRKASLVNADLIIFIKNERIWNSSSVREDFVPQLVDRGLPMAFINRMVKVVGLSSEVACPTALTEGISQPE